MHIPDGLLDPLTCAGTAAVSAVATGYALRRVKSENPERVVPLMGVMAACAFAAQMLNFPIPGGTSGHVLGGVLTAVLLGPWVGMVVLTVVLVVQCLLFQDGGVTALGANVLNVAVVGPVAGYAMYDLVRRWIGGLRGILAGAVIASWFTVMAAAALCALEMSLGGHFRLRPTLGVMLLVHSVIGVGEALATGLALGFILQVRPDLVHGQPGGRTVVVRSGQVIAAGLTIALVMAAIGAPFASTLPDGLEASAARLGFSWSVSDPLLTAPWPDYDAPAFHALGAAGSIAGTLGTVIVFVVSHVLARRLPRQPAETHV